MVVMRLIILISVLLSFHLLRAQEFDSTTYLSNSRVVKSYLDASSKKTAKYERIFIKNTLKKLQEIRKIEKKIFEEIQKNDSALANLVYKDVFRKYEEFEKELRSDSAFNVKKVRGKVGYLDTLDGSLQFLKKLYASDSGEILSGILNVQSRSNKIKSRLGQVQQFQEFISQRRAYLRQHISRFHPKHLLKLNKEVYYYSGVIKRYKNLLSDPAAVEQLALSIFKKNKD